MLASLRTAARLVAVTAGLAGVASCVAPRNTRCQQICTREGDCVEADEGKAQNFDQSECVSACAALARDAEGSQLVDRHEQCVAQAKDCAALLACE